MTTETAATEATTVELPILNVHILKENTCRSLSGKSELTYHIGHKEHTEHHPSGISFRLFSNSSSGVFNDDWVG